MTNELMNEICTRISRRTAYRRINRIRQITGNSISRDTAICILASKLKIDVFKRLQNNNEELLKFQQTLNAFDFEDDKTKKDTSISSQLVKDHNRDKTEKDSPYDYPLSKFNVDKKLIKNCKMTKPYREAVREAALELEVRIRNKLKLSPECTGKHLILQAKKMEIFQRSVSSESDGLFFTYMGAFQWLRNPPGHQQVHYTKEEAIKIILYFDYLIKLFDNLEENYS